MFVFQGCKRIGPDDPWLSLRTRDKRIIGKWEITRLYFYDGKLSGLNNLGDPEIFIYQLEKSGKYYKFDSTGQLKYYWGNWWWIAKSDGIKEKERILLNRDPGPWTFEHEIEMLKFKEIRSKEFFDPSDLKREMRYTWKRLN